MPKFLARGTLRGDKVRWPDGVGICIWRPFDDDEDAGMCFDLLESELDDAINLLLDLREAPVQDPPHE